MIILNNQIVKQIREAKTRGVERTVSKVVGIIQARDDDVGV